MRKKTFYAFIISFVLLIAVIVMNRISFNNMRNYSELVDHTREVITTFENISNDFKSALIYSPSLNDTPENRLNQLYKTNADQINHQLFQLKQLVSDNPQQYQRADTLSTLIHSQLDTLLSRDIRTIALSENSQDLNDLIGVDQIIDRGINAEKQLLSERHNKLTDSRHLTNLFTIICAVIAVGIIIFTFLSHLFIAQKRKWLEGFLESIFNTTQNAIVYYRAIRQNGQIIDFKIEYANRAVFDLFSYQKEEVIGKRLKEITSHTPMMFDKFVDVIKTGKPETVEYLYKSNHFEQWIYASITKMEDGITASFHNITPLKKYEEELKENIKELKRSNSELEQYAYIASHDLQEPLRKIRSFGSYLQETQGSKMDEKGREQLEKIMASAERMSILIKDILSFSSIKKQDLLVPTDLNKILKAVKHDLDMVIQQKDALITNELLPTIEAIPLQMNQLFYNLLNNALKFSKIDAKPIIALSCRKLKEHEKPPTLLKGMTYYQITVKDNGIGFNQDYEEQIFGLFKRLNDRNVFPGSGIGLALCKKVVENHYGEIIAKGRENEGAEFIIYLPEMQGSQ